MAKGNVGAVCGCQTELVSTLAFLRPDIDLLYPFALLAAYVPLRMAMAVPDADCLAMSPGGYFYVNYGQELELWQGRLLLHRLCSSWWLVLTRCGDVDSE